MAALIGLSTAIFAKPSHKNWSLSKLPHLGRHEIFFSGSPNFKKLEFDHHLILFRRIAASPLVCKSQVTSDAQVLSSLETAASGIDNTRSSNTVHVIFELQKECKFGDQFYLVGSDPATGIWDPSCAIPLIWSDGHKWTVELDLRVDMTMRFKFILKQRTGEVIWQPGPDRIFKACESKDTVVVAEDWESAEAEKIADEQTSEDRESAKAQKIADEQTSEDWESAEAQKIADEQTMNPDLEPVPAGSLCHLNEEPMATNVNKDAVFGENVDDWENPEPHKTTEEKTVNSDLEPVLPGSFCHLNEQPMATDVNKDAATDVNEDAVFGGNNNAYAADNLNVNKDAATDVNKGAVFGGNNNAYAADNLNVNKDAATDVNKGAVFGGNNNAYAADNSNVNKDAVFGGNNNAYAADNLNVNNELISKENVAYPAETHEKVKDEGSVSNRKEMLRNNNDHRSSLPDKNWETTQDEENMFSSEEDDALVPGLTPRQVASNKELLTREIESVIADATSDEV